MRLLQLWIMPRTKGSKPRWEQKQFSHADRAGKLLPIVSDGSVPGTLAIDQNATVYVSELKAGERVNQEMEGSHGYFFVIAGAVSVNGKSLANGDQAKMVDESSLEIRAEQDAHVMLLDLP